MKKKTETHYRKTIVILFIISIILAVCICKIPTEIVEAETEIEIVPTEKTIEETIEEPIEKDNAESVVEEVVAENKNLYDMETVEVLTNLLYGEARGIDSDMKKSAVVWCVLNRYDTGKYGKTIIDVATAKNQFCGYVANRTYDNIDSYNHCKEIVIDVLDRYYTEEQIGRTLPQEYLYFLGFNGDNWFTAKWQGTDYYNWSLGSPYKS